jgi:hypothetical protein
MFFHLKITSFLTFLLGNILAYPGLFSDKTDEPGKQRVIFDKAPPQVYHFPYQILTIQIRNHSELPNESKHEKLEDWFKQMPTLPIFQPSTLFHQACAKGRLNDRLNHR